MSDGRYDAPAYCDLCDAPIATGPLCQECIEDFGHDPDDWGGMTPGERTEFVTLALENGNITDAINFIMHDGDVRADSVALALAVAREQITLDPDLIDDGQHLVNSVISRLIRHIENWKHT
jgi:hypothetical protein